MDKTTETTMFEKEALARLPYLIAALVMLPDSNRRFSKYLLSRFAEASGVVTLSYIDILIFAFAMIVTILMLIWMVVLMYRAHVVSCNIKGAKAVITFIVSLVGGEVLSKFAISLLLT
ncbi:MAG: hypothetical protein JSV82_02200 [Planctomycetota bacterium]|nr:MAG: hypothetical protein JSV82_02200 [Planctomycetota bacterium]